MDKEQLDPLQRDFVPIERTQADGTVVFRTKDKTQYRRAGDGSIRRMSPKVNGKEAKRIRAKARQ